MKATNIGYLEEKVSETFIIVDSGCPSSLVGREVVETYTRNNNLNLDKVESETVDKYFRFGENRYHS